MSRAIGYEWGDWVMSGACGFIRRAGGVMCRAFTVMSGY
jgi:hypothetical protein